MDFVGENCKENNVRILIVKTGLPGELLNALPAVHLLNTGLKAEIDWVVNSDSAVDLVAMALQLGATFVARSFSGDKEQLVPLIKAAIGHGGALRSTTGLALSPIDTWC